MADETITPEELRKLPRRAIVAFAARAARRVRPLYRPPSGHPDTQRHRAAVDAAIQIAEKYARGEEIADADAAYTADVAAAADDAARAARAAAADAAAAAADAD